MEKWTKAGIIFAGVVALCALVGLFLQQKNISTITPVETSAIQPEPLNCFSLMSFHEEYINVLGEFVESISNKSIQCSTLKESTARKRILAKIQNLEPYPRVVDKIIDCDLGNIDSLSFSDASSLLKHIALDIRFCEETFIKK